MHSEVGEITKGILLLDGIEKALKEADVPLDKVAHSYRAQNIYGTFDMEYIYTHEVTIGGERLNWELAIQPGKKYPWHVSFRWANRLLHLHTAPLVPWMKGWTPGIGNEEKQKVERAFRDILNSIPELKVNQDFKFMGHEIKGMDRGLEIITLLAKAVIAHNKG